MKVLKKIPAHVEEKVVVDKVVCDICEGEIKHPSWDDSKVRIEAVIGNRYPECDCRDLYIIDVCPNCFLEKVKPLIEKTFNIEFRVMGNDMRYENHE